MMNESYQKIVELISVAAERGALKKAVLSKPTDAAKVKCTLTLRLVGGKTVAGIDLVILHHYMVPCNLCKY